MPDLPHLFPLNPIPADYKFIGPLTWRDQNEKFDSRIKIDPSRPLIYISMGSSGKSEDLEKLASLLSVSDYQVIMTTGGVVDFNTLRKYERPGFYIDKFIAGDHVIKSSHKTIVVSHAGLGTVYQALENGAYGLITIPAHIQHDFISKRLTEVGVAIELREEKIHNLLEICDDILSKPQPSIFDIIREELKIYTGAASGRIAIEGYLAKILK